MKILFSLLVAGICSAAFLSTGQADEKSQIIYSASSKKHRFVSASNAARSLSARPLMPAVLAQYDGFVYRSEGVATNRTDVISSRAVMFYVTFDNPTVVHMGPSQLR